MNEVFSLFDHQLLYDDANYCDFFLRKSIKLLAKKASDNFSAYYHSDLSSMDDLIQHGRNKAISLFRDAVSDCVKHLIVLGICDFSVEDIISYVDRSYFDEEFDDLEKWYISVLNDEAQKQAYRTARKQGRSRFVGGGFGLQGMVKGAITAGTLNLATGAMHSTVNLVGNSFSAAGTSITKSGMFRNPNTCQRLAQCLYLDVFDVLYILQAIIEHSGISIEPITISDEKAANSLFQNLCNYELPYDKATEIAYKIFQVNPTELEYYEYCMKRFPDQRADLIRLADYCGVDLTDCIDKIFQDIYNSMPHSTEEEMLSVLKKIKEEQQALDITDFTSETIQKIYAKLEQFDIEARTFRDIVFPTREIRIKAEKDFHTLSELFKNINTWDESECERIKDELSKHDFVKGILFDFEQQLKKRVEEIWSAEDGKIFDNILINTDINDSSAVQKSIDYISTSGRTESKQQYIKALKSFNEKNIKLAKTYAATKRQLFIRLLFHTVLVFGFDSIYKPFIGMRFFEDFMTLVGVVLFIWYPIALFHAYRMHNAWKTLTVNGTVFHPVFTSTAETSSPTKQSTNKNFQNTKPSSASSTSNEEK